MEIRVQSITFFSPLQKNPLYNALEGIFRKFVQRFSLQKLPYILLFNTFVVRMLYKFCTLRLIMENKFI